MLAKVLSFMFRVEVSLVLLQNHLYLVGQARALIRLEQAHLVQLAQQVYLAAQRQQNQGLVLVLLVQLVLAQLLEVLEGRIHLWEVLAFLAQQARRVQELVYLVHKTKQVLEATSRWDLEEGIRSEVSAFVTRVIRLFSLNFFGIIMIIRTIVSWRF